MDPFPSELFIHINFTLILLTLCLLCIVIRFVVIDLISYGWKRQRLNAAVAIGAFMAGEMIRIGWVWGLRVVQSYDGDVSAMGTIPWVLTPLGGTLLQIIGLLCMIRVFSPDDWGRHAWIVCAVATFVITGTEVWIISG